MHCVILQQDESLHGRVVLRDSPLSATYATVNNHRIPEYAKRSTQDAFHSQL
jgi:hypothetical protein